MSTCFCVELKLKFNMMQQATNKMITKHAKSIYDSFVDAEGVKAERGMEKIFQSIYSSQEVFDFVADTSNPVTDLETAFMQFEEAKQLIHD